MLDYTALVEWREDADHTLDLVGAWRARLDEGHRAWLTGLDATGAPTHPDGPRLLFGTDLSVLNESSPRTRG